jgi:transcriptional regulator with XRE-family HTH domain
MRTLREKRAPQYESATYKKLVAALAANTERLRQARNWTQEDAAHECAMALQIYQRIETGRTNPTLTTLARLCEGFGVEVTTLFLSKNRVTP